jgi:hypothetical protein
MSLTSAVAMLSMPPMYCSGAVAIDHEHVRRGLRMVQAAHRSVGSSSTAVGSRTARLGQRVGAGPST